jgi:hypothetical protein
MLIDSKRLSDFSNSLNVLFSLVASKDFVHLFDGYTLCLWDEEEYPNQKNDTEYQEEVESSVGDGLEHSWSNESDNELGIRLALECRVLKG